MRMENNKINLLREILTVRNYTPKTIAIYLTAINNFFSFSDQVNPSQKLLFEYTLFLKNKNSITAVKLFS